MFPLVRPGARPQRARSADFKGPRYLPLRNTPTQASRHRRLQRERDFTGDRLTGFQQVFLRHGLPGLVLALTLLAIPGLHTVFAGAIQRGLYNPFPYAALFLLTFLMLNVYVWRIDRYWSLSRLGWVLYLGALSFWEEWLFRLALPTILESSGAAAWQAATFSALVFAGAHYFTLRWRLRWCIAAFLGGLLLSRQMQLHNDLLLVAGLHWVATLVNTPRPPGVSAERATA